MKDLLMLKLVTYQKENILANSGIDYTGLNPYLDHDNLLKRYFDSHRMKNYSPKTISREKSFLNNWFLLHGPGNRIMFTWEAMASVTGRQRIINYSNALIDSEITIKTVRSYLGILSHYFSYVLEFPYFIEDGTSVRLQNRYCEIVQPVSEFDFPRHVYNGEQLGVPFEPERLYELYAIARNNYLADAKYPLIANRNYAMLVLAGESGLRIDEIIHLEVQDLFFESKKIQTRYAKGTRGSGKRARVTIFTPLARDTIKYYLKIREELLRGKEESKLLFPTRSGGLLDYSSAYLALKKIAKTANREGFSILSHFSWHWMRRIFATRFIEKFPHQLSVLISLLGHVTPNTVHCYIRHSEAWMDKKILDVLNKEFE
jgi:site-specific recombinase XerD